MSVDDRYEYSTFHVVFNALLLSVTVTAVFLQRLKQRGNKYLMLPSDA